MAEVRLQGAEAPAVEGPRWDPAAVGEAGGAAGSPLQVLRSNLPVHLRAQLRSARQLARDRLEQGAALPLPTAVAVLDRLLGGGLPRGRLAELTGRTSSGRFSIVLSTLGSATGGGEAAALVDLGDGFDPQAARAAGVELARLLWLRPRRLRDALAAAEAVLAGGFPLVVLDLGQPPVPGGRGVEAGWLRLARAAATYGAALLVAAPYRVSGTAATLVLSTHPAHPTWRGNGDRAPRLLARVSSRLHLEKARGGQAGGAERLDFALEEGRLEPRPAAEARAATVHLPASAPPIPARERPPERLRSSA